MSATHIRMMQKALEQMNIKLQHVIADITGKSGRAIIQAILSGERNADKMLTLLDGRIKASHDDIRKSLQGVWKEEHIFELRQSYEMYQFYRAKISECDNEVEKLLQSHTTHAQKKDAVPAKKTTRSNKNNINFDASEILKEIIGTDVTQIAGINDSSAVELISEIGVNMDKWPTAKNFTSWLNLAPNNKTSGGKLLSSKIPKKKNRAGQIFKMAAFAVQRSKHWLATFYHRVKARGGVKKAITATARKIAVIFYTMVKNKASYSPVPSEKYHEMIKEQQLKRLKKQALKLGFVLAQAS
jgi:transposase